MKTEELCVKYIYASFSKSVISLNIKYLISEHPRNRLISVGYILLFLLQLLYLKHRRKHSLDFLTIYIYLNLCNTQQNITAYLFATQIDQIKQKQTPKQNAVTISVGHSYFGVYALGRAWVAGKFSPTWFL